MNTSAAPFRIVVIEGDPAYVLLLKLAFQQYLDACVEGIADGEAALRYIQELEFRQPRPCLIVVDLYLPRIDGVTIIEAIREKPALRDVSVAVLTSIATPSEKAKLAAFSIPVYIKPLDLDEWRDVAAALARLCAADAPPVLRAQAR